MIDDHRLQEITAGIADIFPVRRIVLFGSYARSDAHQHSDCNLCVVVAAGSEERFDEWPSTSWLYRAAMLIEKITATDVALSPHVFTETEFESLREREHPFIQRILAEGRVMYEQ
jgi:predicted nucleotidyltransferase